MKQRTSAEHFASRPLNSKGPFTHALTHEGNYLTPGTCTFPAQAQILHLLLITSHAHHEVDAKGVIRIHHRSVPARLHSTVTTGMQTPTAQTIPKTRPMGVSSSRTAQLGKPHLS